MKKYIFMNLKTVFSVLFIAVGLFSCSDDHVIDENPEPEIVYDATLSIALKNDAANAKTKADADGIWYPNTVKNLSVAVFQKGILVGFGEAVNQNGVYKLEDIEVPSGAIKLVVLANTKLESNLKQKGVTAISLYENLKSNLGTEISGNLSMSSGFLNFDLRAGQNYIGYSSKQGNIDADNDGNAIAAGVELKGTPIQLIRNISRVFLYHLDVNPTKDEYKGYGEVSFQLKEIFLTNVKSCSKSIWTASDDEAKTTVEVVGDEADLPINGGDKFWWNGGSIGVAPEDATKKEFLGYDFVTPPNDIEAYNQKYFHTNRRWVDVFSYYKHTIDGTNGPLIAINNAKSRLGFGAGLPLGVDFFVYENTNGNTPTAMVIKGDYTYYPVKNGAAVTISDTYYTIIINEEGKSANYKTNDDEGSSTDIVDYTDVPKYIHQNNEYVINATVVGPGSKKPLDAHISAEIVVKNWDVVEQNEEVD